VDVESSNSFKILLKELDRERTVLSVLLKENGEYHKGAMGLLKEEKREQISTFFSLIEKPTKIV
jgi:hypothetical protein